MTVSISTSADAVGSGWNFPDAGVGPTSAWYAEKPVQCGGKLMCAATTSATLVTAIAQSEITQGGFGTKSPEDSTFPGHV